MKARILERRLFLPVAAFALLSLAATGGTLVARQASANGGQATATACADEQQTPEGAGLTTEATGAADTDNVEQECEDGDQAEGQAESQTEDTADQPDAPGAPDSGR